MRIILDTNIWISFLLGKRLSELKLLFTEPKFEIFVSATLLDEIARVAKRRKFERHISIDALRNLFLLIDERCHKVSSHIEITPIIRDRNDVFILGMIKNCAAEVVVTGDKDLLVLGEFEGCKILTFTEFREAYL